MKSPSFAVKSNQLSNWKKTNLPNLKKQQQSLKKDNKFEISAHFASKSVQNCHRKPQNVPHAQFNYFSQRPRTDLDKRSLPSPKTPAKTATA